MSLDLIDGYLYHDLAVAAAEQLDTFFIAALPYAKPHEQRRELARLQALAAGDVLGDLPLPQQKAVWDREWSRLRAALGSK